jgi:hypothetical protein
MNIVKTHVIASSDPTSLAYAVYEWDNGIQRLTYHPFDEFTEARIVRIIRQNPLTGENLPTELIWEGNLSVPVIMDFVELRILRHTDTSFPWAVEMQRVENTFWAERYKIWRVDVFPSYVFNRLEADLMAMMNWFRYQVFCRLILVAQVLGFAFVPVGAIPDWCHLFQRRPY